MKLKLLLIICRKALKQKLLPFQYGSPMPREKSWKLWVVWLFGVVILIIGVALIAYHVKDLPYTWDYIGLGAVIGLIGFIMLIGATAYIEESGKIGTTCEHARPN